MILFRKNVRPEIGPQITLFGILLIKHIIILVTFFPESYFIGTSFYIFLYTLSLLIFVNTILTFDLKIIIYCIHLYNTF